MKKISNKKNRPLDEERESRSLLSNAVVILHLIFGTLPILLVVLGNAFPRLDLGDCHVVGLAVGIVARFSFAYGISSANGCQNALGQELSPLYGEYAKNVGRPFGICGYHTGNQGFQ